MLVLRGGVLRFRADGLFDGGAQFVGFDCSLVFEDDAARAVVEEGRGKLAVPRRVNDLDGRVLIVGVEEVRGQRCRVDFREELRGKARTTSPRS